MHFEKLIATRFIWISVSRSCGMRWTAAWRMLVITRRHLWILLSVRRKDLALIFPWWSSKKQKNLCNSSDSGHVYPTVKHSSKSHFWTKWNICPSRWRCTACKMTCWARNGIKVNKNPGSEVIISRISVKDSERVSLFVQVGTSQPTIRCRIFLSHANDPSLSRFQPSSDVLTRFRSQSSDVELGRWPFRDKYI